MADAPLGALSGAAGGMADAVAGIIEQRLRQAQVANQASQAQAALAEATRRSQAQEGYQNRELAQRTAFETATTANQAATQTREGNKDFLGQLNTMPIGTQTTPETRARAVTAGADPNRFTPWQPGNLGMSTPQGEVGPTPDTQGLWRGTQAQIEQAAKDAIDRRNVPLGPIERDAQGNFFRIGPDGVKKPVTDEQGNPIKGYQAPVQPFLLQTDQGFMTAPKTGGAAKLIPGPDGQPVGYKPSAQILNREDMAGSVLQHFDRTQELLKEADTAGLLGPIGGRTMTEFLAGRVGSTGDPKQDALLGELRMSLSLIRSGVASLHGRGGANQAAAEEMVKKMDEGHMSYDELSGGLKTLRSFATTYAGQNKPSRTGTTPAGSTGDPLVDRLNQRRQQQQ